MEKISGTLLKPVGLVALLLIAGFAIGGWTWRAQAILAAPTSPTTQATQQTSSDKNEQLMNLFMTNFTSRLGMDEAKLNAAFTGAVNDTAAQAVRDGIITQAEADQGKSKLQAGGLRSVLQNGFGSSNSGEKQAD